MKFEQYKRTCTRLTSTTNILHIRPREKTADIYVLTFSEYIQSHHLLHAHGGVSWGYRRVHEKGQLLQVLPLCTTLPGVALNWEEGWEGGWEGTDKRRERAKEQWEGGKRERKRRNV